MKIQCRCGAKFAFDVTPEMAAAPQRFICPACGADDSAEVNEIIRQQFTAPPVEVAPASVAETRPVMRVSVPAAAPAAAETPPAPAAELCLKHGVPVVNHCLVCQKPICPKCMELFGYVCSVLCLDRAEKTGIEVPVYEGHLSVVRAKARRKGQLIGVAIAAAVVLIVGTWAWYQFYASQPHVGYSVRFAEAADDGEVKFVSPTDVLVLREGKLSRHDLAAKKIAWSLDLPSKPRRDVWAAPIETHWHVRGRDLWLALGEKLVRIDWHSGQVAQEIPTGGRIELFFPGEQGVAAVVRDPLNRQRAWRVDFSGGDAQRAEINFPVVKVDPAKPGAKPGLVANPGQLGGGPAPIQAARAVQLLANRPLPPEDGDDAAERPWEPADRSRSEVIGGGGNLLQVTVRRLEKKFVTVQAMKAPPKTSALNADVSAGASLSVINETLNEWQRDRTGGVNMEDASRYEILVQRLLDAAATNWTDVVTGAPGVFPLANLTAIIAGKSLFVLDRANQKKWQATLAYPVAEHFLEGEQTVSLLGEEAELTAPCVERDGSLFVADQGMVTAFDLASGNVRWRLPSVGVTGLLFDDEGMLYVNSSDAAQEKVKFSQQIDITDKTRLLILKVDPRTGATVWTKRNLGRVARATGKFLYAVEWAMGEDNSGLPMGVMKAHVRVHRLDRSSGKVLWEHYERRTPIAFDARGTAIGILFRKEVEVLKFLSL
jgi:PQQ-like domain